MTESTALLGNGRPSSRRAKGEVYGYVMLALSTIFLTTMIAAVRLNNGYRNFSPASSVVLRGLTQFVLAVIVGTVLVGPRRSFSFPRHLLPLLCFRGLVDAFALSCGYVALAYIPLAVDCSIFYSSPIFTVLLAHVTLGERVSRAEMCSLLFTVVGCILTANPTLSMPDALPPHYVVGCFCSLLVGTGHGGAVICVRALGKRVHFVTNVFAMSVGFLIVGVAMVGYRIPELSTDRFGVHIAVVSSISGFVGQCLLNVGFQYARAGTGMMISCAELPLFYFVGWLFFGEVLSTVSILGSLLVILAALFIGFEAMRKENEDSSQDVV